MSRLKSLDALRPRLAAWLKHSTSSVVIAWRAYGIKPWQTETFRTRSRGWRRPNSPHESQPWERLKSGHWILVSDQIG